MSASGSAVDDAGSAEASGAGADGGGTDLLRAVIAMESFDGAVGSDRVFVVSFRIAVSSLSY